MRIYTKAPIPALIAALLTSAAPAAAWEAGDPVVADVALSIVMPLGERPRRSFPQDFSIGLDMPAFTQRNALPPSGFQSFDPGAPLFDTALSRGIIRAEFSRHGLEYRALGMEASSKGTGKGIKLRRWQIPLALGVIAVGIAVGAGNSISGPFKLCSVSNTVDPNTGETKSKTSCPK